MIATGLVPDVFYHGLYPMVRAPEFVIAYIHIVNMEKQYAHKYFVGVRDYT